MLFYFKMLRLV